MLPCAATALAEGTPIPHGMLELIAEKQWVSAGKAIAGIIAVSPQD